MRSLSSSQTSAVSSSSMSTSTTPAQTPRFLNDIERNSRTENANVLVAFFNQTLLPTLRKEIGRLKHGDAYQKPIDNVTLPILCSDTPEEIQSLVYVAMKNCEKITEIVRSVLADLEDEKLQFEQKEQRAKEFEIEHLTTQYSVDRLKLQKHAESVSRRLSVMMTQSDFVSVIEFRNQKDKHYDPALRKKVAICRAGDSLRETTNEFQNAQNELKSLDEEYMQTKQYCVDYYEKERTKWHKEYKTTRKLFRTLSEHIVQHLKELIHELQ